MRGSDEAMEGEENEDDLSREDEGAGDSLGGSDDEEEDDSNE